MSFLKVVNDVYLKFSNINGVESTQIIVSDPCNDEIAQLEKKFGIEFPEELKEFYLNDSSTILFKWIVEDDRFGSDCKRGYINLISPQDIMKSYDDMILMVEDGKSNPDELEKNEGLQALVKDWPNWIPLFRFPNGDYFCIDKSTIGNPIVFLEHDVMDGGPNVHGIKIAESFRQLIKEWSKLGFVDIYDWSAGSRETGIDIDAPIFEKLINAIK